jgi:HEAT repeat protein
MALFHKSTIEELRQKRDVSGLIRALSDNDYSRFNASAEALGELGDRRAVEPLIAILKDEDRSYVHRAAARALGPLGDRRAVDPLIRILDSCTTQAAAALGELGDARAIPPLMRKLGRGLSDANDSMAAALAKLGEEALQPLVAALSAGGPRDVRLYAATALGLLGDRRAVEPLIGALEDDDFMVYQAAARALEALRDSRAVDPLIAHINRTTKEGMTPLPAFFDALASIGGKKALDVIAEAWLSNYAFAVSHWRYETNIAAITTLGERRDPQAMEPLLAISSQQQGTFHLTSRIREATTEALRQISES